MVVFDLLCAQPFREVKYHGGGEYVKTVFKAFADMYDGTHAFTVCYNTDSFIDDWITKLILDKKITVKNVDSREDIISYIQSIETNQKVVFFAGIAYGYQNMHFSSNVTSIGTCHGLRSIEKPFDKYSTKYNERNKNILKRLLLGKLKKRYRNAFQNALSSFDILITDSYHSEYSIKLNFHRIINDKKIIVLYPLTQPLNTSHDNYDSPDDKYIMMISANRWIKNSYRGVKSIDKLYSAGFIRGYKTRVYGKLPNRIRRELKNRECFEFYDYVSSEELETAYQRCTVLFYPTLNEGFGNVPMEAMKYGKTCIVSGVCSLPEVYGDSVYYCNPYDLMEMENRLLQAVEKPISKTAIQSRLSYLRDRQSNDLYKLCKLMKDYEQ